MIRRLNHLTNLAITGMSVIVSEKGDVNEFGRLVYRGLPVIGHCGGSFNLGTALIQAIHQVVKNPVQSLNQMPIINLSPSMTMMLKNDLAGSRIEETSGVSSAFMLSADRLESSGEDAVLLVEANEESNTAAALLVMDYKHALENNKPIYAVITGSAETDELLSSQVVSRVLFEARQISSVPIVEIGLIATATKNGEDIQVEEAQGLLDAFTGGPKQSCALSDNLSGLLGVIKIAWCLFHRVIPQVSGFEGLEKDASWVDSSFYLPKESRTWFTPSSQENRYAGLDILAPGRGFSHILFCDADNGNRVTVTASRQENLRLFPLTGSSIGQIMEKVTTLRSKISSGTDDGDIAREAYHEYLDGKSDARYIACILGQTPEELFHEIELAIKGVPASIDNHSEWQTPLGSFFTPHPLGKEGKISFVYPGAFNSYPGIGRDLFYLFPILFDRMADITGDIGTLLNEKLLYPRSMNGSSPEILASIETQLNADPITMLISGSCLAFLYTDVLRNIFEIHPANAFGYSLGEVSMMFANRVWIDADKTSQALMDSPLFRTRLNGPQNAVREYWNLPPRSESELQEAIWKNYILMTSPEKVNEVLPEEPNVYLTHINTPRQVAIGGDPAGCRRVIEKLKCKSLQAPFNYAIHCAPIHSEYDMLAQLHSIPVMGDPGMTLYSAANFDPIPIERQSIAENIAKELCNTLDFPRLIQAAYNDGARIFVELGAGSNCARWVNDTLQGKTHAAYSINRKGVDDYTSILRLLARLVSHKVRLNLSVLYQD